MVIKKVLFVRTPPYDLNFGKYNVQQIGMGKAFCEMGVDFDFVTFKKNNCRTWTTFEKNGHKCTVIEVPRFKLFRWGINKKLLDANFLKQYDLVISQEYYQLMTYLISKKTPLTVMYTGPYWNLFHLKISSILYDLFLTKRINQSIKYKFTKSLLAKNFLEKKGYTNVYDIGVGFELENYIGVQISDLTKNVLNRIGESRFLLYVGRIDKNKNTDFLLKVVEKVLCKYPDIKLVVVGKCQQSIINRLLHKYNNDYLNSILKKHSRLLVDNLIHIDSIDNVQLQFLYSKASAFLLPSLFEIFGMVLLDGQIMHSFDQDAWASAVFRYLEDENYVSIVKKNARDCVLNDYSWNSIVRKMLATMGHMN